MNPEDIFGFYGGQMEQNKMPMAGIPNSGYNQMGDTGSLFNDQGLNELQSTTTSEGGMSKKRKHDESFVEDEDEKKLKKKERNREAAKKSREKKKDYIRSLEKQVYKLTNTLKRYQEHEINLFSKNEQDPLLLKENEERGELLKRLHQAVEEDHDELTLRTMLDSLRYRWSATGVHRKRAIHNLFNAIIETINSSCMKFFTHSEDSQNSKVNSLLEIMGETTQEQKEQIMQFFEVLQKEYARMNELIAELREIEKRIENQSNTIQDIVDSLRDKMTNKQAAKVYIWLEKNFGDLMYVDLDKKDGLEKQEEEDDD